ncbi:hypothetical protein KKC63_01160 [Patescibacteria group bacterium]|nr:hypothetical protein [Patescibacteria group bacterium]MBU4023083.1 hypothetical protein [Patescibacteria group bacterium]
MNQDFEPPIPDKANETQPQSQPQPQSVTEQSFPPKEESKPVRPDYKTEEESVFPQQGTGFQPGGLKPKPLDKKKLAIGIIAGILIVLVGVTIVLATKIWDPLWNPFAPNPTKILKQALENMSEVKTSHLKMVLDMDMENGEEFSAIKFIINADLDNTDKDNLKLQMDFDTRIKVPDTDIEMIMGAEMRTMDDIIYFQITSIPFIFNMYLSQVGLDISQWQNKWYHLDPEELGVSITGLGLSSDDKLALEDDLQELYSEYFPAKPIKRLGGEEIDGKATYHFLMALDQKNLKEFVVRLPLALEKYDTFQTQGFTDKEKEEMFADIDKFFEETGGMEFEIFIGKTDKLIYKITAQGEFPASLFEDGEGGISFDVVMEFSNFNEPVEILAPQDSNSIIEVFMGLMTGVSSYNAPLRAQDATIESLIRQIRTRAELIWVDNASYASLCSVGHLNTVDSSELKALREDIISQGSDVTCYAGADDYCISAILPFEAIYVCADSAGRYMRTESNINPCTYQAECIE